MAYADQPDSNLNNNDATAVVKVNGADLALSNGEDNTSPSVGATVTFTVTLTNNGPLDDTGIIITDMVPAGLTYLSSVRWLLWSATIENCHVNRADQQPNADTREISQTRRNHVSDNDTGVIKRAVVGQRDGKSHGSPTLGEGIIFTIRQCQVCTIHLHHCRGIVIIQIAIRLVGIGHHRQIIYLQCASPCIYARRDSQFCAGPIGDITDSPIS